MPEIVLNGASASRYKDARLSLEFKAGQLELYDSDSVWAGSDISFSQYADDDSKTIEAEGVAGLMLIENATETYSLGNTVSFRYIPDNMLIEATDLRWEKKTHWLGGPLGGEVHIKKGDGSEIRGNGFFADTLGWRYELSDSVTGELDQHSSAPASDDGGEE